MKTLGQAIIMTLVVLAIIWVVIATAGGNKEYNDHVCEVYGKQADCKTPLDK